MPEPKQLRRGKQFHRTVQRHFERYGIDGVVRAEKSVSLTIGLSCVRKGRIDVLVDELGDFVAVFEIKATDWNRVKAKNVVRNLWSHQRQLFKYVDEYTEVMGSGVCLGIIYPRPPRGDSLREKIETYLAEYGVPAYWFSEIRSG